MYMYKHSVVCVHMPCHTYIQCHGSFLEKLTATSLEKQRLTTCHGVYYTVHGIYIHAVVYMQWYIYVLWYIIYSGGVYRSAQRVHF